MKTSISKRGKKIDKDREIERERERKTKLWRLRYYFRDPSTTHQALPSKEDTSMQGLPIVSITPKSMTYREIVYLKMMLSLRWY